MARLVLHDLGGHPLGEASAAVEAEIERCLAAGASAWLLKLRVACHLRRSRSSSAASRRSMTASDPVRDRNNHAIVVSTARNTARIANAPITSTAARTASRLQSSATTRTMKNEMPSSGT